MADPTAPADTPEGAPAHPRADAVAETPTADELDDDGEPWRHPPVPPKDEDPLKSLGRSISETVTGSVDDKPGKPKA